MALFKETNRSIKILLVGVNSLVLLFGSLTLVALLRLKDSGSRIDLRQFEAIGGDEKLMFMIVFIPFTLFLIYLGIRFNYFIKNNGY